MTFSWNLLVDVIRFVVLVEAAILIAQTVAIIQRYYAIYNADPDRVSLLPKHVWKIGVSYLLLAGITVAVTLALLGTGSDLTWLSPFAVVAVGLGISALEDMRKHQGTRYDLDEGP